MKRHFWLNRIRSLLSERNVLWLSGVRRAGKTTLCQDLEGARYFDCELPRVRADLEDPELFFRKMGPKWVILDEIHRLVNPSEVLKIAADHFPKTKVVATGSSTLAAKSKFRDTLAGRKHTLWLTPSCIADLRDFNISDINDRMLRGGLPPFLLGQSLNDKAYLEWIESYWAKDLQELFVIERRAAFFKFMEMLFRQSGELFEAQPFSTTCEVSRQTIQNYLQILETTLLVTILRPFSSGKATEIKSQPKVFAFDTGFIAYFRNWERLHEEAQGALLEHLVLNELTAHFDKSQIFFWRDKQKHEIDFVLKPSRKKSVIAIECKVRSGKFSSGNLAVFRRHHPEGTNLLVCLDLVEPQDRTINGLAVRSLPFASLSDELKEWVVNEKNP